MGLTSTMHRFNVSISDVDRGVYEAVELRVARHPSEAAAHMLARVIAYALSHEEGIEMGRGLSDADEPAVRVRDAQGNTTKWIDVGTPSAERMHRASKATPRVAIFTHHDPQLLVRESARTRIHRVEHIEAFALPPAFLSGLAEHLDRNVDWELTRNDGQLYVRAGARTFETAIERLTLG